MTENYIDIVFDGPPDNESGRFVEVENEAGEGINAGGWIERDDGYWVLRIEQAQAPTGDEREELIGLQLASYSKRMSDGYTSSIIRSNEEAAEIVLDAGFRLPVQGEPTDARWIDENGEGR